MVPSYRIFARRPKKPGQLIPNFHSLLFTYFPLVVLSLALPATLDGGDRTEAAEEGREGGIHQPGPPPAFSLHRPAKKDRKLLFFLESPLFVPQQNKTSTRIADPARKRLSFSLPPSCQFLAMASETERTREEEREDEIEVPAQILGEKN